MSWAQQFNNASYQRQNMVMAGSWGARSPFNPYHRSAPQQAYPNSRQIRKHSGARIKDGKNGKPVIFGWNKKRSAFLTIVACPNNGANALAKGGAIITNKKEQEYARWTATIVEKNTASVSTHSALYNLSTGKLYLPDLGMVVNPNAPNGGYFGRCVPSKRR